MVDDSSTWHKFLQGWNLNFTSCGFLCGSLLDKHVCLKRDHMCNLNRLSNEDKIYGYLKNYRTTCPLCCS
jgi:hypothetical protein